MNAKGLAALTVLVCGGVACGGDRSDQTSAGDIRTASEAVAPDEAKTPEGRSFAGEPLFSNPVPAERLAELETLAAPFEAKNALSEQDFIELGRLYVAGNRFRDAINLYTKGLKEHPDSFRLRRHRGHRYINLRELDNAIRDLDEALELIGDEHKDALEYNGAGEPTATYEHWTYYHMGLYHYLNADWNAAAAAYQKCVETATTNQAKVGASDWLYNALQKGGLPERAEAVIAVIPEDLDTNREHPYFKRVMVYKGEWDASELIDVEKPADQWTATDITVGYGIANWLKFNGDEEAGEAIHRKILETPFWNSWAYVVTDKEYERR